MSNKWDWREELGKAHIIQQDVSNFLGLDKSQMSALVKKMVIGQGLTATQLDKDRWKRAIEYVKYKQSQQKGEL
ncbi:hypothetical protein [Lacticaseibacillus paracasei]|uniref:hypothetical protein n=1 Tax=Lacticaseibacillus paracasei TaxID=1597 RepID=UPI003B9E82C1